MKEGEECEREAIGSTMKTFASVRRHTGVLDLIPDSVPVPVAGKRTLDFIHQTSAAFAFGHWSEMAARPSARLIEHFC